MNDWELQQMIKASGWPLAPELLAIGANFNARLDGGLEPLHWACAQGKAGLLKNVIQQGPYGRQEPLGAGTERLGPHRQECSCGSRSHNVVWLSGLKLNARYIDLHP